MVQHLPSTYKALGLVSSIPQNSVINNFIEVRNISGIDNDSLGQILSENSVLLSFLLSLQNILTEKNLEKERVFAISEYSPALYHCGEAKGQTLNSQSHYIHNQAVEK